jgi:hypothetical protein
LDIAWPVNIRKVKLKRTDFKLLVYFVADVEMIYSKHRRQLLHSFLGERGGEERGGEERGGEGGEGRTYT